MMECNINNSSNFLEKFDKSSSKMMPDIDLFDVKEGEVSTVMHSYTKKRHYSSNPLLTSKGNSLDK